MESAFSLVSNGFAVVAADTSTTSSILVHKKNEDKVMVHDSHKLLGASDEPRDRAQFTEYIQKNVYFYQFRNGIPLTTAVAANFTTGELSQLHLAAEVARELGGWQGEGEVAAWWHLRMYRVAYAQPN